MIQKDYFSALPKSELHSHAGRGGSTKYLSEYVGKSIPLPPAKFQDINKMQEWYSTNIRNLASGVEGQTLRWKSAFNQAKEDNLSVMALLFSISEVELTGGMETFIKLMNGFHQEFCPDTIFIPQITFDRGCDAIWVADVIDQVSEYHYFKALDVCNDEFAQPTKNLIPLYRKAKEKGLRLIAHTGEVGTADDVRRAVEELELNEVNHGIAAADSKEVMRFLAENKIQLNVCPTSNVMLSIVEDYAHHPIKRLYDNGVIVTINTDDLLIFNQTVSDEYYNLYHCGLLNETELDEIRLAGLKVADYYK